MTNFEIELYRSKIVIEQNPERVRFAMKRMKNLEYYIQNIKKENPEITANELKKLVHVKIAINAEKHSELGNELSGIAIQEMVAEYLASDEANKKIVEKIIDENKENKKYYQYRNHYTADLKKAINTLVCVCMQEIDEICQNGRLNKRIVSEIFKTDQSYKDSIYTSIKSIPKALNNELKDDYIEILENMKNYFSEFNLFEEYSSLYKQNMEKIGLEGLELKVKSENRNEFTIEKLFDKENLNNLEFNELIYNSIFWENKYAKENRGILDALSIIDANDMWQDILENKKIMISKKQIISSMQKKEILDRYGKTRLRNYLEYIEKQRTNEKQKEFKEERQESADRIKTPKDKILEESLKEEYNKFFSKRLGKPVSLSQDIEDEYIHYFQYSNLYIIKDNFIFNALLKLGKDEKVKNWGYIPENAYTEKENDITRGNKFILIGIDREGYNLPLTIHIHKDMIISGLKGLEKIPIIPIYYGNEDLKINGKYLPTNLYFPLQKKQKGYIKNMLKKGRIKEESRGIVRRIEALLPDKKKYLKQNEEKYIDLVIGQEYKEKPKYTMEEYLNTLEKLNKEDQR